MNIIFSLLLFLQLGTPISSDLERQIHVYYENIENKNHLSESLWSLINIFLDNDNFAKQVVSIGESLEIDWVDHFDREIQFRTLIHDLSLHFENEHLHLFLQLLTSTEEARQKYYHNFYSQVQTTHLKELNRTIAEESLVEIDSLVNTNTWDFSFYLIVSYNRNISNRQTIFSETVSNKLKDIIQKHPGFDTVANDFLYASLFEVLYNQDRFESILTYYDQLIELDFFPNTVVKQSLYWSLDFALFRTGHIDRSLEVQRRHTIPLTQLLEDNSTLNIILASHGGYLHNLGRYAEARDIFMTALDDSMHLNTEVKTQLLHNLSLVYYKLGESDRYIENQMRALEYAIEQENYSDQLYIYRSLHIYYRKNRNWGLALRYIEEAREIAERTNNSNELASIIISKAVYYETYLNDVDQAYAFLKEADQILESTTDYRLKVRALYEQANLYKKMGEYERSLNIFKDVLYIGSENNNNQMYLQALVDLADIELHLGNLESAQQYILEFNIHDVTIVDFHVLVDARRVEAGIAFRERRFRDADRIISRVYSQVLERARNTTDIEAGYWAIETAYLNLFDLYANLLLEQNRLSDLVNVMDQLKTINDASLIDNPLVKAGLLSEEELTENRRITQELDKLRKRLLVANQDAQLGIQNEISALSAQRNQLTHRRSSDDLFSDMNIWAVQSRLKNGEMILHTTRILDNFYVLMIDNNNIKHKKLPFDKGKELMFERAIEGLTTGNTNLADLHDVYAFLGLESLPSHVNSLIIAPDSYLYQLPLDVLPVSPPQSPTSYGSAAYLIEDMEVRYINNLQELARSEPRSFFEYDFTGFGISDFQHTADGQLISLPKAPEEVQSIVSSLDRIGSSRAILESDATPAAFSSSASGSRILHLASHSKISENDPLFSTIYLHPGFEEETDGLSGQLFAYQLFDMNLNNDLIMLNSCESGSGDYFQGSGIMGISRALRYAGARSLILNSWSVNDQLASDFAIEFYTGINNGKTKSQSLREAKIHFLKNKNANPHFWGAYMLNGDNQPVVSKPGRNEMLAILMILFAAGFVFTHKRLNGTRAGGYKT